MERGKIKETPQKDDDEEKRNQMGLAEDARKLREADERKERQEQKWREEEPNERGITMGALEIHINCYFLQKLSFIS